MSHVNIEITRKCNQSCFYCFNNSGAGNRPYLVSYEIWKSILTALHQDNLKSVHFTGGEPFIWSKTIDLIEYAQSIGLDTSILSNGFQIDNLVDTHHEVMGNLKVAQISLDSMDKDIHDLRRGCKGAWQQAIDAIYALRKINVPVEVSCVVDEKNIDGLINVGYFVKSIEAALLIRPLVPIGRANSQKISSVFQKRLEEISILLQSKKIKINHDVFNYVPINNETDDINLHNNVFTVEATGNIRGGKSISYEGKPIFNLLELPQCA
jgi:AdoMet-dependent heme synthase